MQTKKCKKCGEEKLLDEFYKHKEMLDGHLNVCKECKKSYSNQYRTDNIEKVMEYDRNRPNKLERSIANKERLKSDSEKYQAYIQSQKEWDKANRIKKNCHLKVKRAIEKGLLIKPKICTYCGKNEKLQAHHIDYNKPLEVLFLCDKCHKEIHKQIREQERLLAIGGDGKDKE